MKKDMLSKSIIAIALVAVLGIGVASTATRIQPQEVGVLVQNAGQSGKADFSVKRGWILKMPWAGLYRVPTTEQREGFMKPLSIRAADNTQFTINPTYTFRVNEDKAVDVVFNNRKFQASDKFIKNVADRVLEPRILDIAREVSRTTTTESLMQVGGSLKFEQALQERVKAEFASRGIELLTFSSQIEFDQKLSEQIQARVLSDATRQVLQQQKIEQEERNALAKLQAEQKQIESTGLTKEILQSKQIEKWNGALPTVQAGGDSSLMLNVSPQGAK